ncbi:tetratricopeptide repeat protein [Accumulibacter sp.]|uniref:YfgM family protein n=1 Tax=Accumulibacter sp. TaxID=2053492 RepID=UPI00261AC780|nr:tetratricopeptide repeat protein [Accumulibacter sp.]
MATYDLEEQEQIAELKAWWKQYGNLVTTLATVASLGVIAWQGWNWYQRNQAVQASAAYAVLQKAVLDNDAQRIKAASGELLEKYGSTTYAALAALKAAHMASAANDTKTAKLQLQWVAERASDDLRDLARLRLATLLIDEKAYDEALAQLERATAGGFAARVAEVRGDVFAAQGKKAEARTAYQAALTRLDETAKKDGRAAGVQDRQAAAAYRELVQQKLDGQGEGG